MFIVWSFFFHLVWCFKHFLKSLKRFCLDMWCYDKDLAFLPDTAISSSSDFPCWVLVVKLARFFFHWISGGDSQVRQQGLHGRCGGGGWAPVHWNPGKGPEDFNRTPVPEEQRYFQRCFDSNSKWVDTDLVVLQLEKTWPWRLISFTQQWRWSSSHQETLGSTIVQRGTIATSFAALNPYLSPGPHSSLILQAKPVAELSLLEAKSSMHLQLQ